MNACCTPLLFFRHGHPRGSPSDTLCSCQQTSRVFDFHFPLSAINSKTLLRLGAMRQWRLERGWDPNNPARRFFSVEACEHIVVLNKRDLVPEWGLEVVLYRWASI